jgi:heme/copper-type cytochrome/quinol oxidase subunit 2
MWKYKNQTLVSVAGLAIGFVCFAMSALWIRYEMTYDGFHKKADRMYSLSIHDPWSQNGTRNIPSPLAEYLKSTFPEIANAAIISPDGHFHFEYEGISHNTDLLYIDSSFFSVFDVKIVEGSTDFLIPTSEKVAITREKALQLFGNESPVGKKLCTGDYCKEICAVVTGLSKHSNYPFDLLSGIYDNQLTVRNGKQIWFSSGNMIVEIVSGIDMEAFEKKLNEHKFQHSLFLSSVKNITFTPLTAVHYKDPNIRRDVKFQHIIIFAFAGSLLILCTLFNCLTLFASRFRIRRRELALRTVYGASGWSLFAMLSVEFLLSLVASLIPGLALINILSSSFLKVSGIRLELSSIYLESIMYITGIIVVALAAFFLTLVLFRRRTLDAGIRGNKKILRKTSIVVQLTVSIVFAFCTLVILKQMYHLHNSVDLGFSFKNRGSVTVMISDDQMEVLNDKMKQIPEIKETMTKHVPLLPISRRYRETLHKFEGETETTEMDIEYDEISEQYAKFYEFELLEGEFFKDDDDAKYVMIDEATAKNFGWDKAVGKSFAKYVVKGVIKNIYKFSPTSASRPFFYKRINSNKQSQYILFKYDEGSWKTCMQKINKIVEKEFPDITVNHLHYNNMEENYNKYLKSENALLAILTVVSLVCLIVCIFGFVSMVSLTCEERRKEIAIRKINGATIKDILDIFFKEYLTLLAIGALIAFSTGYIIMKRWLEHYVIQTEISSWVYLSILLTLIMVIVMCVGGRVYKASRENPVNALNK